MVALADVPEVVVVAVTTDLLASRPAAIAFAAVLGLCPPGQAQAPSRSDSATVSDPAVARSRTVAALAVGSVVEAVTITSHRQIQYFGLGHFLQRDWQSGLAFLGGEVGLLRLKTYFLDRRDGPSAASQANQDYANIANLTANNLRMVDFYSAYRRMHDRAGQANRARLARESVASLSLSPFKPRYLTNAWVLAPIAIAGVASYFGSDRDRPLSAASEVTMFDRGLLPSQALARFGVVQAFRYTTVAAGEEMFFRGALQTELTEHTTPSIALGVTATLFAAWHVPNRGLGGGLAALAAGLYLGRRYQASNYDLGETIALHFWLDWLPTLIEFAADPEDAPFVYAVRWKP